MADSPWVGRLVNALITDSAYEIQKKKKARPVRRGDGPPAGAAGLSRAGPAAPGAPKPTGRDFQVSSQRSRNSQSLFKFNCQSSEGPGHWRPAATVVTAHGGRRPPESESRPLALKSLLTAARVAGVLVAWPPGRWAAAPGRRAPDRRRRGRFPQFTPSLARPRRQTKARPSFKSCRRPALSMSHGHGGERGPGPGGLSPRL